MIEIGNLTSQDLATGTGITMQGVNKNYKTLGLDVVRKGNRLTFPHDSVRQYLESRDFQYQKSNISFQIVKGGCGKTNLSFALGLRAHMWGARVLFWDLDQQANLSRALLHEKPDHSFVDVIQGKKTIEEILIKPADGPHIIPSNLSNSRLDAELGYEGRVNLREILKDSIAPIRNHYDLVVVDCPPSLNRINTATTCFSHLVVIPCIADIFALDGFDYTVSEIEQIKSAFRVDTKWKAVWNNHDNRKSVCNELLLQFHQRLREDQLFPVVISTDTSFSTSISQGTNIFNSGKKSPAKPDLDVFTREVLGLNDWLRQRSLGKVA